MRANGGLLLTFIVVVASASFSLAEDDPGHVREWLVCGPFPRLESAGRLAFDPLYGEASQCPAEGRFAGGEKWRAVAGGEPLDFLSPACGFEVREHALAYAHF